MNFPFYIAKRYVRSKSSQNAVNIINFITFLVIVIGSAALFIVLSGFAGLKTFSLSFSNTFDPDLKALPASGKFFSITPEQEEQLHKMEGVLHFSKELEERVYLTHRQKSHVAYIKGVDSLYAKVTAVDSTLYFGEWYIAQQQGVVGIGIANLLGLTTDNYQSPLVILAPKPGKGGFSQQGLNAKPYNELPLVISGIYAVEEHLDKKYVFTDLGLVQALLEKDSTQVSGLNFKIIHGGNSKSIQEQLKTLFGDRVSVQNRRELNSTLYRMLNTENLATYLIFTLVLIIALFNVVGAIIMMILDKQQNSKTLYNLGTTITELRRIYFVQGILVTSAGGLIGVGLASVLIWSQIAFGWLKITPSLAYPVEYQLINVLIVLATIVVLGVIASKIASSRISKKLITS
ncbi:FtsX-like permease family protein [Arenibacter sp. GZD96]|uniref:ABC transporter permease n=1 Tax=Aurantibrevibacter litoralis TaxID=3106030 RepID=UPI002AFF21ED|nr:FtsX-like permease family protein [Arenibacter sp. GZD-96]MEA1787202.1 FtsX-like permease family protein [Arenibacter sp. GZD-96]